MTDEQTVALTDALTAIAGALRTGQDPAAAADVVDRAVEVIAATETPGA